jgi:NAD(P)-dependent dehydrogenase (short-subunit alcohol dehydrogenase family)
MSTVPNSSHDFSDHVIFITGGTSGIGLATAIAFSEAGAAHVIVVGRTRQKWDRAQARLPPEHVIEYWPGDVRVEEQVRDIIAEIFRRYGRLDVCFNNAGVQPVNDGDITRQEFGSFEEDDGSIHFYLPGPNDCDLSQQTPISSYCENAIATSIFGVFYCLKWELWHIYRLQPTNRPVAIINTSSRNGILPDPKRPLYDGAKSFINSVTRSVASQASQRVQRDGRAPIRINAIAPGPIDTPLERAAYHGHIQASAQGVPMNRVGQPDEIAHVVLFLANSQQSSYITGAIIPVDGGYVGAPIVANE